MITDGQSCFQKTIASIAERSSTAWVQRPHRRPRYFAQNADASCTLPVCQTLAAARRKEPWCSSRALPTRWASGWCSSATRSLPIIELLQLSTGDDDESTRHGHAVQAWPHDLMSSRLNQKSDEGRVRYSVPCGRSRLDRNLAPTPAVFACGSQHHSSTPLQLLVPPRSLNALDFRGVGGSMRAAAAMAVAFLSTNAIPDIHIHIVTADRALDIFTHESCSQICAR